MSSERRLRTANRLVPARGSRCPELLDLHKPDKAQHLVQFYDDESFVIENVSYLSAKALAAGDSSVLMATQRHLEQIRERLVSCALDLDALQESGRYIPVAAAEALSQFMVGGYPDEAKFDELIGGTIRGAAENSANGFVFAFGEMVALLCNAHNPDAAVCLEQLWNSLAKRNRLSLYCAYSLSSLGSEPDVDALIQICAAHALTIPAETSP